MSREPYDADQHQIAVLEGIEEQLRRIADALVALTALAAHPVQSERGEERDDG